MKNRNMEIINIEWPVPPFYRQPEAVVISDGLNIYLIYPTSKHDQTAILKFSNCESVKYGSPNDEVFDGWELSVYGVEPGDASIVKNSPWVDELKTINMIHSQFDENYWNSLNHFIFSMKDYTFECVAEDIHSEVFSGSTKEAIVEISGRLHYT